MVSFCLIIILCYQYSYFYPFLKYNHNIDHNNRKFKIQYTEEELDKIQYEFLQELRKYFAKVNYNNNISRKNEVEIVPPTLITIEVDQKEV